LPAPRLFSAGALGVTPLLAVEVLLHSHLPVVEAGFVQLRVDDYPACYDLALHLPSFDPEYKRTSGFAFLPAPRLRLYIVEPFVSCDLEARRKPGCIPLYLSCESCTLF
jgi:hypothetical protein